MSDCVSWLDIAVGLVTGVFVILGLELFCWYLGDKCK